jgi:phosphohistidine phosphatase
MRLYLIHRGEAWPKEANSQRPLTKKGIEDIKKIAYFLKQAKININTIFHSGKKRAQETASILAETLNPNCVPVEKKGLAPTDPIDNIYKEILSKNEDLMIVGHLPHLSKLASKLLLHSEDKHIIEFRQGGVVLLEKIEEEWKPKWFIIPDLFQNE